MSKRSNAEEGVSNSDYLPASEVMRILGIRLQTVYSYASRGWLRSVQQPGRKDHLYAFEDVEKLRLRSDARRGHGAVAASAMQLGQPIIPTNITEITPDGPRYRNHFAVDLVKSHRSFETTAELLWSGILHEEPMHWKIQAVEPEIIPLAKSVAIGEHDHLLEIFALSVLTLGMTRGTIFERVRHGDPLPAARQIIQTQTGCFGYASSYGKFVPMRKGERVAEGLIRALKIKDNDDNLHALESILILLADHELAPATFAARIAASWGCALHQCIVAAISTNTGIFIGRTYDRVEDILHGASTRGALVQHVQRILEKGHTPPGFNHPVYPKGDPRAYCILDLVKQRKNLSRQVDAILGLVDDAASKLQLYPRHELAVITLAIALGLPRHCAGALFTLARTAGWVAHVLEQRLTGTTIRPRAKYIGARDGGARTLNNARGRAALAPGNHN